VAAAASRTTRLLLRAHGGAGTRRILAEFWKATPPLYTASDEAQAFFRFLAASCPALPGLAEAMAADAQELVAISG